MKILLVRLGALGDIVHAIPVAAALRRVFPTARIDWVVSSRHREILDLVPVVDRRLAVDDSGLLSAIGALRRSRYDVAIDLQGLLKSALITRSSGARRVIGFSRRYLREPLARLLYTDVYDPGGDGMYAPREKRHVVQINLGLLKPLGIESAVAEFPFDDRASAAARELVDRTGGHYALLNPGAAWSNKRWPPARFADLAMTLERQHRLVSAVLWGPGERELADAVVAAADRAAVRCPPTALADVVAIARGAAVMVSGDTGPTHIAAAVGTPIVGIYGPTRPERNGPWRPGDETVSRAAVCRCHHLRRCRAGRMCLLDIPVDEVARAVGRVLEQAADRRRARRT